jgi:hypothetical protein
LSYDQIAVCLQMSTKARGGDRRKDVPGLQGAIDRGRAAGVKAVTNALYESAVEGNLGAQVFYLKNRDRDNWQDRFDYMEQLMREDQAAVIDMTPDHPALEAEPNN